jgi:hypothetical protein
MAITAFVPVGRWLAASSLSQEARAALRNLPWLAPVDETLHILALTTVFASAAILNLRVLGLVAQDRPLGPLAKTLLPLTWTALVVALLTGSLLVLNRPPRYFRSDMFIIKMGLVLLGLTWTAALQIGFSRDERFWDESPARRMLARSGAVAGLLFWCGAVVCGRWIAYA